MISVIVPVYNEKGNILKVIRDIENVLSSKDELIVVDDGSIDGTVDEIKQIVYY